MNPLTIIKVGGNVIDDESALTLFLIEFAKVSGKKILVHGGGKVATQLAEALHIAQEMVDGRRITDAETLKVVTMVYAGLINKNIVAKLQANYCNAVGLCGADGNVILAHKRISKTDFGYVGDVDEVNVEAMEKLLCMADALIVAPITHDGNGQLLNTNADTIAQEIAKACSSTYATTLIYSFEKPGVLLDANDDTTVIPTLHRSKFDELRAANKIFAGMIPKLENALSAVDAGVKKVIIGKASDLQHLIGGQSGTAITSSES